MKRRSWKTLTALERHEHLALMQWVKMKPLIYRHLIHIANERECSAEQRKLFAALGVMSGCCDFFLFIPIHPFHGMWLELKRRDHFNVSLKQREFLDSAKKMGYATAIAKGWEEAKEIIESYLKGEFKYA
jgi:hypothetical protein